jgi:hypothetical protein
MSTISACFWAKVGNEQSLSQPEAERTLDILMGGNAARRSWALG